LKPVTIILFTAIVNVNEPELLRRSGTSAAGLNLGVNYPFFHLLKRHVARKLGTLRADIFDSDTFTFYAFKSA